MSDMALAALFVNRVRRRLILFHPAKLAHGPTAVPDFCHMADPVTLELHHINMISISASAGGRTGATLAGMCGRKDAVSADVLPFLIGCEGFKLIAAVGHELEQPLHPFGVVAQCADLGERLHLR